MSEQDIRHRKARQQLFMVLNDINSKGVNPMESVDAIEELIFSLISVAFATHPATKDQTPPAAKFSRHAEAHTESQ